jgi:uncharacterized phage protein gp47/JayE
MATEIRIPKVSDLYTRARNGFLGLIKQVNLGPGSDYDNTARVMATTVISVYGQIQFAVQQIFPRTARGEYLKRHAKRLNLDQKPAAKADGFVLIAGVAGSIQPSGTTFTAEAGTVLLSTASKTITLAGWSNKTVILYDDNRPDRCVLSDTTGMVAGDVVQIGGFNYVVKDLPGGGAMQIFGRFILAPRTFPDPSVVAPLAGAAVPVQAQLAGPDGNLAYQTELTVSAPATGVDPDAVVLELSGGADLESEEDWGRRIEEAEAERLGGGNRALVLTWMLMEPGVSEGWVYDIYRGPGTANCIAQGIPGARHLSGLRLGSIQTNIAPRPPTDANPGLVQIGGHDWIFGDATDRFVAVDLLIEGGPGYGPDWQGSLTTAAGCTTVRINTTTDPRAQLVQGNRIAVPVGPRLLEVGIVETLDATGINLRSALPFAPIAGKIIDPASALTETVRDVLLGMFALMGPGDTVPPTRYPSPTQRGPDKLTLNLIHHYVRRITGVSDVTIASPSANVIPAPMEQCVPLSIRLRQ